MAKLDLEEGEVILCTVARIEGTVVFVKIEPFEQTETEGTIIMTELSSGRIRNIRDYVVPNKKIVCKVIKIDEKNNIHLSLRRVTNKEKKEVMEKFQQERSYISVLNSILKENAEKVISKIKEESNIYDFLENSKKDPKKLEALVGKTSSEKILEIISTQKKKKTLVKKTFQISSLEPDGLKIIKEILTKASSKEKEIKIKYLGAGKYTIEIESTDLKSADNKISEILELIEKDCKKMKCEFSTKG